MTKDALIEALARWRYQSSLESMIEGKSWEQASDYGKAAFLAEAREVAPVIAAFFRHWLVERCQRTSVSHWLVHRWDEEMGE
jgi:hypothetical protein